VSRSGEKRTTDGEANQHSAPWQGVGRVRAGERNATMEVLQDAQRGRARARPHDRAARAWRDICRSSAKERQRRTPTRAQRSTAFWLEDDAASRETSCDDLAVDARTAHFADIATLVVHIAYVDLCAPVPQSHRVTFNRANRAGIAQNRWVWPRLVEIRLQRLLIGYMAAASGKENAEHDQRDPTHSVRRLKQAAPLDSSSLPGMRDPPTLP
jgi:hypothetical protein